jgi:hypothetical protein
VRVAIVKGKSRRFRQRLRALRALGKTGRSNI